MKNLSPIIFACFLVFLAACSSSPTYENELRECLKTQQQYQEAIDSLNTRIKDLQGVLSKKQEEVALHRKTPLAINRESVELKSRVDQLEAEVKELRHKNATLQNRYNNVWEKLKKYESVDN